MTLPRLRLFLVRHGQVESNRELRYVGSRDEPLTALGREQAERLGRTLAVVKAARLYSSPLRRARETAAQIAAHADLELQLEPRLAEQSFGTWEGLTRSEVQALGPEQAERLRGFHADPAIAPPQGEALLEVQDRVAALVEDLVEDLVADPLAGQVEDAVERRRAGQPAGSVILVSHVGPIKALLASALDISLAQVRGFFLDPGTLSVIDCGRPSVLRLFNAHAPLQLEDARWW